MQFQKMIKRFQAKGMGSITQSSEPMGKLVIPSPPELPKPKNAVQWIIAQQQAEFGETILDTFSYAIILRNMKLLYKKYDYDKLMRAILDAQLHAQHPYSTAFIEDQM